VNALARNLAGIGLKTSGFEGVLVRAMKRRMRKHIRTCTSGLIDTQLMPARYGWRKRRVASSIEGLKDHSGRIACASAFSQGS